MQQHQLPNMNDESSLGARSLRFRVFRERGSTMSKTNRKFLSNVSPVAVYKRCRLQETRLHALQYDLTTMGSTLQ